MTAIKQPKSARNCSSGNRQKHECFLIVFDETIQEPGFSFTHVKLLNNHKNKKAEQWAHERWFSSAKLYQLHWCQADNDIYDVVTD